MNNTSALSIQTSLKGKEDFRAARQIDMFEHVAGAYAQTRSGRLSNDDFYRMAIGRAGIKADALEIKDLSFKDGKQQNNLKRKLRWHQQNLRRDGLLTKVEGARGVWELTKAGREKLRTIRDDASVLAYSTDLGIAVWSNGIRFFENFDQPIFLALTSLPYPLAKPRAYGNPKLQDYVDFVCHIIEPICKNLVKGGNVALSLSNDIFEPGSPARSTYLEELTLALNRRLNLSLMERAVWESNKPPGPIQWASKERMQLNVGYEPILIFCNSPLDSIADNRRVLEPHSERHKKLIAKGGESRHSVHCDGAYRIKPGSYSNPTEGRIPRNVFKVGTACASQRAYKQAARGLGLQAHGASMPLELARRLVRFLTSVGQLVVDPCFGSGTTLLACELEDREYAGTEIVFDYARGSAERFKGFPGYKLELDCT